MYILVTFHQSLDRLYRKVAGGTVLRPPRSGCRAAFVGHYRSAVYNWQRTLLRRLDSVAMIYEQCLKILDIRPTAMPLTIRFPRDSDFDGMVIGTDGMCVGFMRMGKTR